MREMPVVCVRPQWDRLHLSNRFDPGTKFFGMFADEAGIGIIQRHKLELFCGIKQRLAAMNRLAHPFHSQELRAVEFLMGKGFDLFHNSLCATHGSEMPAAVLHEFVTAVPDYLGRTEIAIKQHARPVPVNPRRWANGDAIDEVPMVALLQFEDEGIVASYAALRKTPGSKEPDQRPRKTIGPKAAGKWVFTDNAGHRFGSWNFVHIGNENPIIRPALRETAGDAVALKIFRRPGIRRGWRIFDDDVDDPMLEFAKPLTIFVKE